MRLIDADALIRELKGIKVTFGSGNGLVEGGIEIAISTTNAQPTVDAVERKRGKWSPVDSYSASGGDEKAWEVQGNPIAFYYCSECKEQTYAGENGESLTTDFCPFCGADMRGENNG